MALDLFGRGTWSIDIVANGLPLVSASTYVEDYQPSKSTEYSFIKDMRHNCTFRVHTGATWPTLRLVRQKLAKRYNSGEFLRDCCRHLYPHMHRIMDTQKQVPHAVPNELHHSLLKIAAAAQTDRNWAKCAVRSVGIRALEGSALKKSGYWVLLESLIDWLDLHSQYLCNEASDIKATYDPVKDPHFQAEVRDHVLRSRLRMASFIA